ncbi:hypothetical protein MPL3356_420014 [Mesorhizobium plurifarium]|uniref:Uncharacterized protein n=1 Tax=Mesorhizobium plurifarium TaxID=69974 RepID=A0A090EB74_MESPL|nr:hypothetical protein MPL3356_420014 [Mesorhizobium plurifarium]
MRTIALLLEIRSKREALVQLLMDIFAKVKGTRAAYLDRLRVIGNKFDCKGNSKVLPNPAGEKPLRNSSKPGG